MQSYARSHFFSSGNKSLPTGLPLGWLVFCFCSYEKAQGSQTGGAAHEGRLRGEAFLRDEAKMGEGTPEQPCVNQQACHRLRGRPQARPLRLRRRRRARCRPALVTAAAADGMLVTGTATATHAAVVAATSVLALPKSLSLAAALVFGRLTVLRRLSLCQH